jgi:uncharacterized protein (DUF1697 family)
MTTTIRYVAFLRGVNVGGRKLIKMENLVRTFGSAGFQNVRTLIASGNVMFDARATDPDRLGKKIEKTLLKTLGYEVAVIVRTIDELKQLVKLNPFKKVKASKDKMMFVTLISSEPKPKPKFPLRSEKENLEVLVVINRAAFMVAYRKKTGWFAFPNNFIEKLWGVIGTTRNFSTLERIAAMGSD